MYKTLFHTHVVVVTLFLLIYLVKTILLVINKKAGLAKFTKVVKVPEMIISFVFLLTGVWMVFSLGEYTTLFIIKIGAVIISIPLAVIGFKKENKALAILSFVLIISAYGMAEANKGKLTKPKALAESVIDDPSAANYDLSLHGKALFVVNCAACHGADGKLGLSGAADLSVSELSESEITEVIVKGKGIMKGYKENFSEAELQALTSYVQTLKQ
ncbi:c-type cytochrome [Flammeovirgaceae bacterium SG7u.111]|nr:c-type cytochrome [Flammeovirgaceae bacterium SG7u.132]WPO38680.1 c-type cytochrome [Flammeovirgaceae bacterium SG7u.111]